jgi:hypothetical protein
MMKAEVLKQMLTRVIEKADKRTKCVGMEIFNDIFKLGNSDTITQEEFTGYATERAIILFAEGNGGKKEINILKLSGDDLYKLTV